MSEPVRLSPRQAEILELLARDLALSEIAAALFISRETVKTHIKWAKGKYHCHTLWGLVAAWMNGPR